MLVVAVARRSLSSLAGFGDGRTIGQVGDDAEDIKPSIAAESALRLAAFVGLRSNGILCVVNAANVQGTRRC